MARGAERRKLRGAAHTLGVQGDTRVAFYARVSTGRQAAGELSIPDQLASARAYCAGQGWTLVAEYVEPASGRDEDRPEFQRLMEVATSPLRPYDVVLVHSLSRLARDVVVMETSVRRLAQVGARLVSMTQHTSSDTTGDLLRQMIAAFDEHQSAENAKHTLRAMRENARQGFWNGSNPPFGYTTEAAGQRGARMKKVLRLHEAEASVVRRICAMHLGAEGGPLGVKGIADRLNREGVSFRGRPFSISNVHRILTSETYVGRLWFNKVCAKTGTEKARDEWIEVAVPAIITQEQFNRVQTSLASRAPERCPPRVTSSPVLLTGLATCATCGAGMTLRTGKSGRYRYYTCAAAAHRGTTQCSGRSVPMEALDRTVVSTLADRVLQPSRLEAILQAYLSRTAEGDATRRERLGRAKKEATEAAGAKSRLLQLVAAGALAADDPDLIEQLRGAEARRRRAEEEVTLLEGSTSGSASRAITPGKIQQLGDAIRQALQSGSLEFRRAYVRLIVSRVVVGDEEIRVSGSTGALARAAAEAPAQPLQAESSHFDRVWRREGNPNTTFSGRFPP